MSAPHPQAPLDARAVRRAVFLLGLATFFTGMALRVCDGLIPTIADDFDVTPGVAGRVVFVFALAYGFLQLVFGPIGDRFGKARVVTFAIAGSALLSFLAALASGFPQLLAARIAWGMAAAGVVPLAMAWIGDAVPLEERQPTLARLLIGTVSGMMAGQLAGGLFADSGLGWRGAFAAMALGYGVVAVLLVTGRRVLAAPHGTPPALAMPMHRQWALVLATPWRRKVIAAVVAEGALLLGPLAFLPAMLHQRFGLALSAASALLALYAAGGVLYAMTARWILLRFGQSRMVLGGGAMMGASYLLLLVSPVAWTAAPAALALGFGAYLYHNTLQTHSTQMVPTARGTAVSTFSAFFFLGQAAGVGLAGLAFDRIGHVAMLLAPAVALPITAVLYARAMRAHAAG
ncbi:MAG TPA: MFS transporter [Ramlibacter sp.]|nr:MFS transporter [Ramlibacter sp.]